MWYYNYAQQPDELYHYGVPGMKWGRRKAIKQEYKTAREHYKKDLENAAKKAEKNGDTRSYWMQVSARRGANYANNISRGALGGAAVSALFNARKFKNHAISGKQFVSRVIAGAAFGAGRGTVSAASRVGRGMLIAESDYGVKSLNERYTEIDKKYAKSKKS